MKDCVSWAKNEIEKLRKPVEPFLTDNVNRRMNLTFNKMCDIVLSAYTEFVNNMDFDEELKKDDRYKSIAVSFLKDLLSNKPIEPIDKADFEFCYKDKNNISVYKCTRDENIYGYTEDGKHFWYSDKSRYDFGNFDETPCREFITKILDDFYPIIMPYIKCGKYLVDIYSFKYEENSKMPYDTFLLKSVFGGMKADFDIPYAYIDGEWKEINKSLYLYRLRKTEADYRL